MVKMEVLEKGLLDRCVRYLSVRWGVRKKGVSDMVCQIVVPDRTYQIGVSEKGLSDGYVRQGASAGFVEWWCQVAV